MAARGSSTCPVYPVAVGYEPTGGSSGRPRVRVDLDDAYPGRPCTKDLVLTTHVVALPGGAPAEGHLELLLVLREVRERVLVH
ncbi:hypothetical protein [Pseudokineococcus basanitobsidens]|uniref:hypothetical protein n=1 Tax=Pseudokineococcus basanitobsidens TaxID=1926649 RepID=UPI0030D6F6AD